MPRLALCNMFVGFLVIAVAAAAGSFVALDVTQGYLRDPQILDSWRLLLLRSAHGHTNLFGMLHVLFGLTMAYSALSARSKVLQTMGLFAGVIAMAVLMPWRANIGPTEQIDLLEILTGVLLSAALAAVATHAYGLAAKIWRRE